MFGQNVCRYKRVFVGSIGTRHVRLPRATSLGIDTHESRCRTTTPREDVVPVTGVGVPPRVRPKSTYDLASSTGNVVS